MNLTELQGPLIALAKAAGKAILEVYEQPTTVHMKADHSPVTQADIAAHEILTKGLQALTPEYPVLSEEGAAISWEERQQWQRYWLIDPLDGTRQFIRRSGEFTVNVALIDQHEPIIGLLYVPVTREIYYASRAWGGAYKCDASGVCQRLSVRPWQKNQTTILTSQQVARSGRPSERMRERFGHLGEFTQISMSSAWKFGWVAEGKADLSPRFGDTSEWDTAAGQCILELAGGALVDLEGNSLRYNMHESLLNPHFIAVGDGALLARLFDGDDL